MMTTWMISRFGDVCPGGNFLFFPPWYKYLQGNIGTNNLCTPTITGLNDVWLIVAAVIEILLRIASLAAVGFIIYGGFEYLTGQAEPDKMSKARQTVINALVGLVIAVLAAATINFLAGNIAS